MAQFEYSELRQIMVQIIAAHAQVCGETTGRPVLNPNVVAAMEEVPRHEFVPADMRAYAYADGPLPIGYDKTISQPFIVALIADLLELEQTDTVLEVGTGLGYQAAVLSRLTSRVLTMDIIQDLATDAIERLFDFRNVEVRVGNGYYGWSEHAPYDKIVVAAAPTQIPEPLVQQLKPNGRMVLPLGSPDDEQHLVVVQKDVDDTLQTRTILPVRFAPMVIAH